jgi:hypothetical protein|tara:strand:+ start:4363 stop:4812 length:450 start_codon:yes stop_codon:yes gene_type:complete
MKKFILTLFILINLSCVSEKERELNFYVYNNLPIINAHINGFRVKLLIDTGASVSLIDTSTETLLLFTRDFDVPVIIGQGMGGEAYICGVKDIVLEYEGKILNVNFRGADLSDFRENNGIHGIIGSDFLLKHSLVIDYYNRTIKEGVLE